jgi:nitronate monooxygenase
LKNELCKVIDIEKPIVSAPMGGAAGPDIVAAVSNAGSFGVIPLWAKPVEEIREGIAQVGSLTSRNFAVNLNLSFPYQEQLQVCIEKQVHAVSLFWGMEPSAIESAKSGDLIVMADVGSAEEARTATDAGADVANIPRLRCAALSD